MSEVLDIIKTMPRGKITDVQKSNEGKLNQFKNLRVE
jgi:hypothetical protein